MCPTIFTLMSLYCKGVIVTPEEVSDGVFKLKINKSCVIDNVTSEHLKYASLRLCPLLTICFTGCLVNGLLPESLMSILLVPVIMNKQGKVSDIDNYKPIDLANSISKVLKRILSIRLKPHLLTTSNQFGFKQGHGIDTSIFALKELV